MPRPTPPGNASRLQVAAARPAAPCCGLKERRGQKTMNTMTEGAGETCKKPDLPFPLPFSPSSFPPALYSRARGWRLVRPKRLRKHQHSSFAVHAPSRLPPGQKLLTGVILYNWAACYPSRRRPGVDAIPRHQCGPGSAVFRDRSGLCPSRTGQVPPMAGQKAKDSRAMARPAVPLRRTIGRGVWVKTNAPMWGPGTGGRAPSNQRPLRLSFP